VILALAGLAGLIAGVFGWPAESWETPLTVAGGLSLASAHVWNMRSRCGRAHAHS
jgi:hypothetical protein